jgi:hypothetical protein
MPEKEEPAKEDITAAAEVVSVFAVLHSFIMTL